MIRKYFCIWIERYINQIRLRSLNDKSSASHITPRQVVGNQILSRSDKSENARDVSKSIS